MKKYKLWFLMLIPLLITSCHYQFTSPFLWDHESSAAFEVNSIIWVIDLALVWVFFVAIKNEPSK